MKRVLADAQATELLGEQLAPAITPGIIYMRGDLGAGKTTLARGLLRGLGHTGKVRSPTYTLVEPYALAPCRVYHLDLYRLADAEELEWLGLRDMLADAALLLVEWPERGSGYLPAADLTIDLGFSGGGRVASMVAATPAGQRWLDQLAEKD
ncbi:MAG TPA: tRNA (adenosine(37)-N6)-threonylcarbamoyltransferase complex ATPase subunit type 1 TsaE [Gammaproteobacteria bacterium]|nr:tRNA (adenosine(37)-N6)-threonylcarbamoyltransferase complex ATPase subunit type 1 TsaE [Gammaproteobacteria bacterium]